MALILYTGILYAAADADDAWHARAAALLSRERGLRIVPVTVLPEVCYLLHDRLGAAAERAFLAALGSELAVEPLQDADLEFARELLDRQRESGFVEASVGAGGGRLRIAGGARTERGEVGGIGGG